MSPRGGAAARAGAPRPAGRRMMLLVALAAALAGAALGVSGTRHRGDAGVSPERAADWIHAVIDADRTTYTKQVVNRLQVEEKVFQAKEHFREEKALPLPAQMLRMGAQIVAEGGEFRYALISDAAINKSNLPKGDFESEGVRAVRADPSRPWRTRVTAGNHRYLLSLYPDRAVAQACITCHNGHPQSPRHDWKLGDVMGAVVVSVPLE